MLPVLAPFSFLTSEPLGFHKGARVLSTKQFSPSAGWMWLFSSDFFSLLDVARKLLKEKTNSAAQANEGEYQVKETACWKMQCYILNLQHFALTSFVAFAQLLWLTRAVHRETDEKLFDHAVLSWKTALLSQGGFSHGKRTRV